MVNAPAGCLQIEFRVQLPANGGFFVILLGLMYILPLRRTILPEHVYYTYNGVAKSLTNYIQLPQFIKTGQVRDS